MKLPLLKLFRKILFLKSLFLRISTGPKVNETQCLRNIKIQIQKVVAKYFHKYEINTMLT